MLNQVSPAPTDQDLHTMWRAEGGHFHGPVVETGTMPEEKLLKLLRELHALRARYAEEVAGVEPTWAHERFDDTEIEHQQSWSISSGLAAIPESLDSRLPTDLAYLIARARQLHPEMALKARERSEAAAAKPSPGAKNAP